MRDAIEFVKNYNDLSTENGFQYEFFCNRCESGFRTKFREWSIATLTNIADAVGDVLGGVLGRVGNIGDKVKSAKWEKAHDEAFKNAVSEIRPEFIQCPRCNEWICRSRCWNTKKGLCKTCAPDLGVEMAAAQSSRSVEEVWRHAKMSEEDKKLSEEYWREGIVATCPKCEKPLEANARFCPSCGEKLKEKKFCADCGANLSGNPKFCPECGKKLE